MPLYRFECNRCGAQELEQMTFGEHDEYRAKYPNGRPHDWHCKGELMQVLDFHINLGMREHYSAQLDTFVSSDRQFNSELSRQQDEYQARMGFDVKFETIDPNDAKAAGVTDAGLESTERAEHAIKSDGHKSVFS